MDKEETTEEINKRKQVESDLIDSLKKDVEKLVKERLPGASLVFLVSGKDIIGKAICGDHIQNLGQLTLAQEEIKHSLMRQVRFNAPTPMADMFKELFS